MDLTLLLLAWLLYFALHSWLASNGLKAYVEQRWPRIYAVYRIIFNGLALLLLLPLMYYSYTLPMQLWWSHAASRIVAVLFMASGLYFLYAAFSVFDTAVFLGLKAESTDATEGLVTRGMYRYVRHPLYFATLLLFWGLFLWWPSAKWLAINGVVTTYLIIGSRLEERKLEQEFGSAYRAYKKEVKGLIPYLF